MLNTDRGPEHDDGSRVTPVDSSAVRLIAFYLPQFHAIPENDRWWGAGFTEWTNVTKALPRFAGHYQPRLPGALGFYDLSETKALRRQAELARRYGIHGFCFHHYWFGGDRLLERPLDNLLANPDIDLPFCINWANENWSRRWDGRDDDILMAQNHSPEDDLAFARSIEPLFADPRYIRIDGRPLLMLYRPGILPDATATIDRWRNHFVRIGEVDPFIVMAQAFGDEDPRSYGMDGAVAFPPHRAGDGLCQIEPPARYDHGFRGTIRSYHQLAQASIAHQPEGYIFFPGVCPQWDNEARKPARGMVYAGSTPSLYGQWLDAECRRVLDREPDHRIVFINAWNEWAEGAHLEPDRHYGHAYLAATAQVLSKLDRPAAVGFDAPTAMSGPESGWRRRLRLLMNGMARILDGAARGLRSL